MNTIRTSALASLLALALPVAAFAADHADSPAASNEPSADITDAYAWMTNDAAKLNLIMNVHPIAGVDAKFSDAVQYVFHINSSTGYGEAQSETLALCQLPEPNRIQCWIGDEYVTGDPSDPKGLSSASGKVKVFAGLRNDPFFMELSGFVQTVDAVIAAAPSLIFDENSCPAVDADTSGALVGLLQSNADGGPARDNLAGANVLSLVVQVDKSLVNKNGSILSVWTSTHRAE